ncbi:MAG: TetR/AcrR family transcriptional regulator [Polyangiaceae bacterium]
MSASSGRHDAPLPRRRDEARTLFRNAILEAAEAVFAERGFHRARIQDVAARARIAVGTVYNHFDEKEDVLRALLEERTEGLVAQMERRSDDPSGFEEGLTARIERMLHYVETHRSFFTVAAEHGAIGASSASATVPAGKAARSIARARATFAAVVEEGIAAGELQPLDANRLARVLGALFRAFSLGALEDGRTNLAADAPLLVRLFLRGASSASKTSPRASKRLR